jgi:Au+-exporting ATPase
VTEGTVNLATETAQVDRAGRDGHADFAIKAAGYAAPVPPRLTADDPRSAAPQREAARLQRDLILAAALTLPVFVLEMGGHMVPAFHHWVMATIGQGTSWLIQFVLAGAGRSGAALFRQGPACAVQGRARHELAGGGGVAGGLRLFAGRDLPPRLLPPGTIAVYYEAAAVIVTLILLGRLLEARAKGRTSEAIKRLVGLQPKIARVRRDGQATDLPVAEVVGRPAGSAPGRADPRRWRGDRGRQLCRRGDDHRRAGAGREGPGDRW